MAMPSNDPRNCRLSKAAGAGERILPFPQASPAAPDRVGATALELVNKAAELIRGIENRSTDIGARARTLVHRVLQLAEARIRTVEAERQSAVDAAEIKVEELQDALEQARSRASAAEVQISAAEMRAKAAEARASEAMNALARIEDAIRTQILEPRRDDFSKLTAVA